MSVPPVVASTLNTRARPIPEITDPIKHKSKTFDSTVIKVKIEHTDIVIEETIVAYTVPRKNLIPKTTAPIKRSGMLSTRNIAPVFSCGKSRETITTIPASPPGAIFAGSIKRAKPSAKRMLPKVTQINCFNLAHLNYFYSFFSMHLKFVAYSAIINYSEFYVKRRR